MKETLEVRKNHFELSGKISAVKQARESLDDLASFVTDPTVNSEVALKVVKFYQEKTDFLDSHINNVPVSFLQDLSSDIYEICLKLGPDYRFVSKLKKFPRQKGKFRVSDPPTTFFLDQQQTLFRLLQSYNTQIHPIDYDELTTRVIDSLNLFFNYEQSVYLVNEIVGGFGDYQQHDSTKKNYVEKAAEFIKELPLLFGLANEINFDVESLRKIILDSIRHAGFYNLSMRFYMVKLYWALLSSKRDGVEAADLTTFIYRIGQMGIKEHFMTGKNDGTYQILDILPAAFELGLSTDQVERLVVSLETPEIDERGELVYRFNYSDFSKCLLTAKKYGVDAETFIFIWPHEGRKIRKLGFVEVFPGFVDSCVEIFDIDPVQAVAFLYNFFKIKDYSIFQLKQLCRHLELVKLFASKQSLIVKKIKKAVESFDLEFLFNETDFFDEQILEFIPKSGELTISTTPYKIESKSRRDGEIDLYKLAASSLLESSWFYDEEKQTWFCVGGQHESDGDSVGITSMGFDIERFSKDPEFYHIHPHNIVGKKRNIPNDHRDILEKINLLSVVLPSQPDLEIVLNKKFKNNRIDPIYRIVSVYGIVSVKLVGERGELAEFLRNYDRIIYDVYRNLKDEYQHLSPSDFLKQGLKLLNIKLQPHCLIGFEENKDFILPEKN